MVLSVHFIPHFIPESEALSNPAPKTGPLVIGVGPPSPAAYKRELKMNGPATNIVGSLGVMLTGAIVGWLVSHNVIPAAQIDQATAVIGAIVVAGIGGALVWFKANMATVTSHIAAVNAAPGVKVVAQTSPAPQVSAAPTLDDAKIAAVNAIDGVKVVKDTVTAPIVTTPPKTS